MRNTDEQKNSSEGKIIQEHLESINMDPWFYIYQVYVNPPDLSKKKKTDDT